MESRRSKIYQTAQKVKLKDIEISNDYFVLILSWKLLFCRPHVGTIPSSTKCLFLILQESLAAKKIPKHRHHDKKREAPLKIAIQDGRQFPTLQRNFLNLDVGYFHHVLVSKSAHAYLHSNMSAIPAQSVRQKSVPKVSKKIMHTAVLRKQIQKLFTWYNLKIQ